MIYFTKSLLYLLPSGDVCHPKMADKVWLIDLSRNIGTYNWNFASKNGKSVFFCTSVLSNIAVGNRWRGARDNFTYGSQ
jgi:hypothetical protein